ncbi:AaceriAEL063Wp [[Ashbya] aceris (nom. inval.)]|nr:AaceriAEL063Wp [[Ashbya] aceris (nom. inval.)]
MLNFLPGQPNSGLHTVCQKCWNNRTIIAYCSGNNLIIMSNRFSRLQTIYFEKDATAVDICEQTGQLAVAVGNTVYVYGPEYAPGDHQWVELGRFYHDESRVNCVRWAGKVELVVASAYMSLWRIRAGMGTFKKHLLWSQRQPAPVYNCAITDDAEYIATVGKHDTRVKVWRRLSNAAEQAEFDLTVIPHGGSVTMLRWRRSQVPSRCKILYVLGTDAKLRMWSNYEMENKNNAQDWGTVELDREAHERFVMILDSRLLVAAMPKQPRSELLLYLEKQQPELVGIVSSSGRLRILALEHLSQDPPRMTSVKRLATLELLSEWFEPPPQILYFCEPQMYETSGCQLSLVIHDIRGSIKHVLLPLENLFHPSSLKDILEHRFTGHSKSIQRLWRSSDGEAVLTISRFHENAIWVPQNLHAGVSLQMQKIIETDSPIHLALVHEKGALAVTLLKDFKLQAWDCTANTSQRAKLLAEVSVARGRGYPILMANTPEKKHDHERHFVTLLYDSGHIDAFLVTPDRIKTIESGSIDLEDEDRIYKASTIDPVQPSSGGDRDLITLITRAGTIRTYKAVVASDLSRVQWMVTHILDTDIQDCSLIAGSSINKTCVIDSTKKEMSIWDLKRGVLEYTHSFDDAVQDIDWTSTETGQSIISIGFHNHVLLLTQQRYDYTNKLPTFLPIKRLNITKHTTHEIGDSTWMKDGTIVVASGNQIFVEDKQLDLTDSFTLQSIGSRCITSNDLLHLTSVLNGPLPVYHPQFLIQALYFGKLNLVKEIILNLFLELREREYNPDVTEPLPSSLCIPYHKFLLPDDDSYTFDHHPEPYSSYNIALSDLLREKLTKIPLPYLTRHQQITLITVLEAIESVEKNNSIVDSSGLKFILGMKLFVSHKMTQPSVTMRDVMWAVHSENNELLQSLVFPDITSTARIREYKVCYWVKQEGLVRLFESVARYEFTKNDKRDPSACAIFYLALKKKKILLNLWRVASGHPEQAKMLNFLENDFTQSRWKTAALKNAFVLASKHRYLDSACFFLLAGSLKDAVNVLVRKLEDLDMAIGVCRVYSGDNSAELHHLLTNYVLPRAIVENDVWTMSYVYWRLKNESLAIKSLLGIYVHQHSEHTSHDKSPINKSFLMEDPALLHLYSWIRTKSACNTSARWEANEQEEYLLMNKVADIYRRMGCDYLSLSLLRNWKFTANSKNNRDDRSTAPSWSSSQLHFSERAPGSFDNRTLDSPSSLFDKSDNAFGYTDTATPRNLLDDFMNLDSCNARSSVKEAREMWERTPGALSSGYSTHTENQLKGDPDCPPAKVPEVKNLLDDFM